MFFSLDVLRARKGDCLMLHFGAEDDPHLMLIDGGPSDVYKPFLKPRLQEIHQSRELDERDPLPVDVVMVSHVDDDHIKGILDLTKEQRGNNPDLRLDVTSLWHNSFDDLLRTKPDELVAGFGTASVETSAAAGEAAIDSGSVLASFGARMLNSDAEIEDEDMHQTVEVLSSIPQGRALRDDAKALGWKPNDKFKGKLILATETAKAVMLGDMKVTVVGPMQPELLALQEQHDEWLRAQKEKKKKSPEAALSAFVDPSIPNLSSIVVLAELGGKSMLLTGDARGDKILEGMELAELLEAGKKHVDLLKVPHHGSDNNMETSFFERVTAEHYVFSGDGEHGNPERTTLQMLLDARGDDAGYTIHLTYPVAEIDVGRKADWEKEQNKEKKRKQKKPATKVREDWSPAKHSLAGFFKKNPKMADKVSIVDPEKPHLINLLKPVKF